MNEYSRTELLIGEEGLGRLKQATVMVFGVGGVGSHCIEALARSGVGRLILIDNDKVSLTNINRQSIAYHSTIGRMKTEVMRERIRDINPEIVVKTYETFVLPDLAKEAGARVVGTGRSDFPNQVNNVVAFPGIFKGALEGRATQITEEMKLATANAIASLVSDEELNENNILPEAFDSRVADVVSKAVKELI